MFDNLSWAEVKNSGMKKQNMTSKVIFSLLSWSFTGFPLPGEILPPFKGKFSLSQAVSQAGNARLGEEEGRREREAYVDQTVTNGAAAALSEASEWRLPVRLKRRARRIPAQLHSLPPAEKEAPGTVSPLLWRR